MKMRSVMYVAIFFQVSQTVFGKEEQGMDYIGNDTPQIRYFSVSTKEDCRADCKKDLACKLWLFVAAKDEREEEGYDFPGHDIRSPKRAADLTKDECKQDCVQTPGCTRWMFIEGFTEGVNYCWVKNDGATIKERYEGIGKAFSAVVNTGGICHIKGAVGEKTVYNGEGTTFSDLNCQTNSDCNDPGYDYNGGDMQGGSHQGIATANECSCLCEENSNCVAWTWVESGVVGAAAFSCFLKNGQTQKTPNAKTVSGKKTCAKCTGGDNCCTALNQCGIDEGDCDNNNDCYGDLVCGVDNCPPSHPGFDRHDDCCAKVTNPSCNDPGYDYYGGDLHNGYQETETALKCSILCEENEQCFAWTWVPINSGSGGCWLKNNQAQRRAHNHAVSGRKTCAKCTGGNDCCTALNQCGILEGDCDNNNDCKGDLVCGVDNCGNDWGYWGLPAHIDWHDDCCYATTKIGCDGDDRCCTISAACGIGEGDCDVDDQCQHGLKCGENNCDWDKHNTSPFYANDDCCQR